MYKFHSTQMHMDIIYQNFSISQVFSQKIATLLHYFRAKRKSVSSETKKPQRDNIISKLLVLLCISKITRCVNQVRESRLHKATFVPY